MTGVVFALDLVVRPGCSPLGLVKELLHRRRLPLLDDVVEADVVDVRANLLRAKLGVGVDVPDVDQITGPVEKVAHALESVVGLDLRDIRQHDGPTTVDGGDRDVFPRVAGFVLRVPVQHAVGLLDVGVVPIVVLACCPVDTDVHGPIEHSARLQHSDLLTDAALGAVVPALSLFEVTIFGIHRPVVVALVRRYRVVSSVVQLGELPRELSDGFGERFRRHVVIVGDAVFLEKHVSTAGNRFVPAAGERRQFSQVLAVDLLVRPATVVEQLVKEVPKLVEDTVAFFVFETVLVRDVLVVIGVAAVKFCNEFLAFLGDLQVVLLALQRRQRGLEPDVFAEGWTVALPPLRRKRRVVWDVSRVEPYRFRQIRVAFQRPLKTVVAVNVR